MRASSTVFLSHMAHNKSPVQAVEVGPATDGRSMLTAQEAARRAGVDYSTVSRAIRAGAIAAVKAEGGHTAGGRPTEWRIAPAAVDAWLASRTRVRMTDLVLAALRDRGPCTISAMTAALGTHLKRARIARAMEALADEGLVVRSGHVYRAASDERRPQ